MMACELRYNGYVDRYERAKERYDTLALERKEKLTKAKAIDRFMQTVERRENLLTEFEPQLWLATVENVTVMSDGKMKFLFYDGTEVTKVLHRGRKPEADFPDFFCY